MFNPVPGFKLFSILVLICNCFCRNIFRLLRSRGPRLVAPPLSVLSSMMMPMFGSHLPPHRQHQPVFQCQSVLRWKYSVTIGLQSNSAFEISSSIRHSKIWHSVQIGNWGIWHLLFRHSVQFGIGDSAFRDSAFSRWNESQQSIMRTKSEHDHIT
jgi:hypothetical protein